MQTFLRAQDLTECFIPSTWINRQYDSGQRAPRHPNIPSGRWAGMAPGFPVVVSGRLRVLSAYWTIHRDALAGLDLPRAAAPQAGLTRPEQRDQQSGRAATHIGRNGPPRAVVEMLGHDLDALTGAIDRADDFSLADHLDDRARAPGCIGR